MIERKPHDAVTTYLLCREFCWTPRQLERQKAKEISRLIVIMNEMDVLRSQMDVVDDYTTTILVEDDEH